VATLTPEVASKCGYRLERGGKPITGPSVRLAEMAVSCWGNIRAQTRVVGVEKDPTTGTKVIVAQAVCHDLEANVMVMRESRRRITNRNGQLFNEDMISMAGNAAASIAYREAVFKVVPQAMILQAYDQSLLVARGQETPIAQWRDAAIHCVWNDFGVDEDRLVAAVGRNNRDELTREDLLKINQFAEAIREGQSTIDEVFPEIPEEQEEEPKPKTQRKKATSKKQNQKPKADTQDDTSEQVNEAVETMDAPSEDASPGVDPLIRTLMDVSGFDAEQAEDMIKRHCVSTFKKAFVLLSPDEREQMDQMIRDGEVGL